MGMPAGAGMWRHAAWQRLTGQRRRQISFGPPAAIRWQFRDWQTAVCFIFSGSEAAADLVRRLAR
jgi:hypothetical protein